MKRRRKTSGVEAGWEKFAAAVMPHDPAEGQAEQMRMAFVSGWFAGLVALQVSKVESGRPMQREWQTAYAEAEDAMNVEAAALQLRCDGKTG